MKRTIFIISSGMDSAHARLQPWKYLWETGRGLVRQGYHVTIVTDVHIEDPDKSDSDGKLTLMPLVSLRSDRGRSSPLAAVLEQQRPQVILWHVGKTSFLRGPYLRPPGIASLGIFTSPIYHAKELLRIGLFHLLGNLSLSAVHMAGAFLPAGIFRRAMQASGLDGLVTETETTANRLVQDGLWKGQIKTIFPAVDAIWQQPPNKPFIESRQMMGLGPEGTLFLYLGAPDPLRGLPTLLKAFQQARQKNPAIRLLVLSREAGMAGEIHTPLEKPAGAGVWTARGSFPANQLANMMAASDVVALPFLLVPSDAPLSLLEAAALQKPVITTHSACLPELAAYGRATLVNPGDVHALSSALLWEAARKESNPTSAFTRTWDQVGEDWARLIESL